MSGYEINSSGILQIRGGEFYLNGILPMLIDDKHLDFFECYDHAHPHMTEIEFHRVLPDYYTQVHVAPSEDIRE